MSLPNFIRRTHLLIQHGLHETRPTSGHSRLEQPPELTRLEERLLFSASAIAPIAVEMAEAAGAGAASTVLAENSGLFTLTDGQLLEMVADTLLPSRIAAGDESSAQSADEQILELVFLDSSISNLDQMMADLSSANAGDPSRNLEFILLDSQKDGIAQITSALLRYNGVDGLHIVSHGEAGQIQLGSTKLSLDTLDRYRPAISAWQYSMSEDADILIYGCNLGASADGQNLISEISQLTDSETAASDDLTGHESLGGDWELEYQTGRISTQVAFSDDFQATWEQILATYTVTTTADSGAGSLRQAILDANANAGTDTITFNISSGAQTINLLSNLPQITDTVILDATTQSGYSNAPLIEINGNSYAAATVYGFDLGENADNSIINGFVINRFATYGIYLNGADNVTIAGNYIGTNAAGTASQANGTGICSLAASSGNIIGGSTSAERNVISGNTTTNITILGDTNVIKGNYVGTSASGLSGLTSPTGSSILITSGASNAIGGLNAGEGNVITNGGNAGVNVNGGSNTSILGNIIGMSADKSSFPGNTNDGIVVSSASSTGNVFLQNRIAGNGGLGIDLNDDGVTANDAGDADTGGNGLQNFPVLTSANSNSAGTTIVGTFNSNANTSYRIEFFSSATADTSGNGEGQTYLGFVNVTSNSSGNSTIDTTLSGVLLTAGHVVSATATVDLGGGTYGSTSEFAANVSASGLVGHWRFDAHAQDISGNGYDGTLTNGAVIDTTGGTNKVGAGKLSVDGVNDFVDLSAHRANFASLPQGTIAGWVKTSDTSGTIFALDDTAEVDSFADLWITGGRLIFEVYENNSNIFSVKSNATVNDNNWHHVAVTVDASGNKLFIDGVQAAVTYSAGNASSTMFLSSVTGVDKMLIGADQNNAGLRDPLVGLIDDVRVYNRALTSSEVSLLTNTAPTLESAQSPAVGTINEDPGAPSGAVGTLVSSLVDFASPSGQADNVTDLDSSAQLGIAITATNSSNGSWWYSTNGGTNWISVGATSDTSALLLAANANTRIYFQANPDDNGTLASAMTFRAWDQTGGTNGGTADTSINGGITAFSSATDVIDVSVTAVNDSPVLADTALSITVAEDAGVPTGVVGSLISGFTGGVTEVDRGAVKGIAITASVETNGTWYYTTNGGTTWTAVGTVSSASSLLLADNASTRLHFAAGADYNGTSSSEMTVRAWDQTGGGTAGTKVSTASTGGSHPFSAATDVIDVTVTAVNDTPVITSNGGGATAAINVNENSTSVTTVTSSDVDGGTAVCSIVGGADQGLFSIHSGTGALTFITAPNFELPGDANGNGIYEVTVEVSDGQGGVDSQAISVTSTDVDEFDVGPVSDSNVGTDGVNENAANGTMVGITVSANDSDGTTNAIAYSLDDNAGGRFTINSSTGVVTVADGTLLNREAAASHGIVVRATSADGSSSTQAYTVSLSDQNDSPPRMTPGQQFSLSEASSVGAVVGDVIATDSDSVGTLQNWTITGGNTGGVFGINPVTGRIFVVDASQLNFENTSEYTLTLTVFDGTATSMPATVQILVLNEGEVPVFTAAPPMTVPENSAAGTVIGSISATDQDTGELLTYSIVGGSPLQPFAINALTGQITVFTPALLDFEAASSWTITARVTDTAGLFFGNSFVISVTDVNEVPLAVADQFTTMQFGVLSVVARGVLFNDLDPEGAALRAVLVRGPANGSLTLNADGSMIYTPSGAYTGIDSFLYVASDGVLSGNIVSVTVTIQSTISSGGSGSGSGGTGETGGTPSTGGTSGSSDGTPGSGGSDREDGSDSDTSDDDRDVRHYGGPGAGQIDSRDRSKAESDLTSADTMIEEESTMTAQMQPLFLVAGFAETAEEIGELRKQNPAASTVDRTLGRLWGDSTFEVNPIDATVAAGFFRIEHDADQQSREGTDSAFGRGDKLMVCSTAVVTTSLSVGYVIWILRGGSLLTAFMSSLPAWHAFDPLTVLQSVERRKDQDDDSLLTLVTGKAASAVKGAVSR